MVMITMVITIMTTSITATIATGTRIDAARPENRTPLPRSFARQQAMTTIGASVLSVAAGEAGHVCAIDPVCFTSKRRPQANGERPLS